MPTLTLAISPCPNDTFIFDAILHQRIDTEGLDFQVHFADVEQLNQAAFAARYDITKLSYHAYAYASEDYILLRSGSALGNHCGPLLISKDALSEDDIHSGKMGIPGKYTTANFLFSLRYPEATNKVAMLFSDIEQSLLDGELDAGVIIHENRFTYAQKGLKKIIDLGDYWENTYHAPIPLGGIAIKRNTDKDVQLKVQRIIRRSIAYAFEHPEASAAFVAQHSQEMDAAVCQQHIQLYVNQYSLDLGEKGEHAIRTLYRVATERQLIPVLKQPILL